MSQPDLPSALHEGAVYNAPQLQLMIIQVLAQLQHDRELAKLQNEIAKSQLNRKDRCHKEQLRRMIYEHEVNEQVEACRVRTNTATETAAEVQRLLEKSKREAAVAVEEARGFKEMSAKLQQKLELETNKSISLQDLLIRSVTSGLNNLTTMAVDNQAFCHKEKQALQEKLENEKRKFEKEKQALQQQHQDERRKFEEEKGVLQQASVKETLKFELEKQALEQKFEDEKSKFQEEKRRCDERNSLAALNVVNVLQQLNDTTSANRQMTEYIKQTLLADLQSLRTSLQSNFSSFPAKLEQLQSEHSNITKNLDKYIIRPQEKEKLRLLTRVLKGHTMKDALMDAAIQGNVTELEILLDSGANIESVDDEYKGTPLNWAAAYGQVEACIFLIERGADLGPGVANYSPLHSAASRNKLEVVKLLVEKGADVTAKNGRGKTPADLGDETIKAWFRNRSG